MSSFVSSFGILCLYTGSLRNHTIKYDFDLFLERLDCIIGDSMGAKGRVGGPNACEVKPNSKPWIVRLKGWGGCAGTLVSRNIVLTAAHCVCIKPFDEDYDDGVDACSNCPTKCTKCVTSKAEENITIETVDGVVVGDHNRLEIDEGEKFIEKSHIIAHEKYTTGKTIHM